MYSPSDKLSSSSKLHPNSQASSACQIWRHGRCISSCSRVFRRCFVRPTFQFTWMCLWNDDMMSSSGWRHVEVALLAPQHRPWAFCGIHHLGQLLPRPKTTFSNQWVAYRPLVFNLLSSPLAWTAVEVGGGDALWCPLAVVFFQCPAWEGFGVGWAAAAMAEDGGDGVEVTEARGYSWIRSTNNIYSRLK